MNPVPCSDIHHLETILKHSQNLGCLASTSETLFKRYRQEDHDFQATLGYRVILSRNSKDNQKRLHYKLVWVFGYLFFYSIYQVICFSEEPQNIYPEGF